MNEIDEVFVGISALQGGVGFKVVIRPNKQLTDGAVLLTLFLARRMAADFSKIC